eukprot:TRINITY_DN2726_c0_g1_i5.p1 TRINITY_DN2726_c0_g1~~TRINITY_DN2726_c0_g1_i5.p1  ORF type:complete len:169 (+),score=19.06 TRINITY_DN2726_c0_g1_i5:303-809(+)
MLWFRYFEHLSNPLYGATISCLRSASASHLFRKPTISWVLYNRLLRGTKCPECPYVHICAPTGTLVPKPPNGICIFATFQPVKKVGVAFKRAASISTPTKQPRINDDPVFQAEGGDAVNVVPPCTLESSVIVTPASTLVQRQQYYQKSEIPDNLRENAHKVKGTGILL